LDVSINVGGVELPGEFVLPEMATAAVVFAHGSGSSHRSPRNQRVAGELQAAGYATLLFDLLTAAEGLDRRLVFDVRLLTDRLMAATDWLREQKAWGGQFGYFGASIGSAAALSAAVRLPELVGAVVSRGGRPDLVGQTDLVRLTAPTLLIVGGNDPLVQAVNEDVDGVLRSDHRLEVIPGATHLFEEAGAMERVTQLATDWFRRYLQS
jgi:putative phosphoribosyl transferase